MVEISRRDLAKIAVGTGLSAMAANLEAQEKPVAANDKIGLALVGCGGMGRGIMRRFLKFPEIEMVAICDVDKRRLKYTTLELQQTIGRIAEAHFDFREVMDRKDVHVVINGTPDHWHALPTIMACQAGKDVYTEKPLALTIGEGRAMVDAARKYDRVVQMGTQQRSGEHFEAVADFIRSGELGKVRLVRAWAYLDWVGELPVKPDEEPPEEADYDMWLGPAPRRPFNPNRFHFNFRWFWDYGGGLMTDWGAHMLDFIQMALDVKAPKSAASLGGKFGFPHDAQETPDTQQALLEYDGFSILWEHATGIGRGPFDREHGIEFHGNNGILVVDRNGWEVFPEAENVDNRREYKMRALPLQGGSGDMYHNHVLDFLECVKRRQRPRSDVEKGHDAMKACHLANIALRTGRTIAWDDEKEEIINDPEAQRFVWPNYREPWKLPKI